MASATSQLLPGRSTIYKGLMKDPIFKENVSQFHSEGNPCLMKDYLESSTNFLQTFENETFNFDLSPVNVFSNTTNHIDEVNIKGSNENEEESKSISDMFTNVYELNEADHFVQKKPEFLRSWLMNQIPFKFLQPQIPRSNLTISMEKQEREIAYNLLVRKIIDESLDRSSMFSRQPKELLDLIHSLLVRQFPEYEEVKHRSKVRNYLKACRRNFQKNNGSIVMKNNAQYISSGPGYKLMYQIYNIERDSIRIIKKESDKMKVTKVTRQGLIELPTFTQSAALPPSMYQRHILNTPSDSLPILPASMSLINTSVKPMAQLYASNPILQIPFFKPFNGIFHTESIKKAYINSDHLTSEAIRKNITDISKIFLDNGNNSNVENIVLQLKNSANFMEKMAETLELSLMNLS